MPTQPTQKLLLCACMCRTARSAGARAHPASAEDVAVCKVLGGQVPDGEARQDDARPAGGALVQLVVDDVPLGVHNLLVLRRVAQPDLQHTSKMGSCIHICTACCVWPLAQVCLLWHEAARLSTLKCSRQVPQESPHMQLQLSRPDRLHTSAFSFSDLSSSSMLSSRMWGSEYALGCISKPAQARHELLMVQQRA